MGDDADPAGGLTTVLHPTPYRPRTAEVIAQHLRRKVIDGELKDGDFLPTEAALMGQLDVSRSTLREAIRLLEAERFLEVRPGSRSGARVRVPGPETLARPAGFLLEMSAAPIADVIAARSHIEVVAVSLLAERARVEEIGELDALLRGRIRCAWETGELTQFSSEFGRRMVDLAASATLALMVGMLDEIAARHVASPRRPRRIREPEFDDLRQAYADLIDHLRVGDVEAAQRHWRNHLQTFGGILTCHYGRRTVCG